MKQTTLEWHDYSIEKPEEGRHVLYAITYDQNCEFQSLIGRLSFTTGDYYLKSDSVVCIAWAYFDDNTPLQMLSRWKENNTKSPNQFKLEKIKELENRIKALKEELE